MNNAFRSITALLCCLALLTLGVSLYLQYVVGLTPCPLCLLARFLVLLLAILSAIGALHNPGKRGQVSYGITLFTLAILGMAIAIRHLWIMQLPPEKVPACTPGLDYLLDTVPMLEAVLIVLNGSGECAHNDGSIIGLSLPAWTLVFFIIMAIGSIFAVCRQKKG